MIKEKFAKVFEAENSEFIEIPVEEDDKILLSSIQAQFPECTGLKYKGDTGAFRGVKLAEGKLYPPEKGWEEFKFLAVIPKNDLKRRNNSDDLSNVTKLSKFDNKKCTDLIILNLSWKTNEKDLESYFSSFGEILFVEVKRDPQNNKSRGYGFIRFANYESQIACLAEKHYINDRLCTVKVPCSKIEGDKQEVFRKVHIDKINESTTQEQLKDAFSKFGNVNEIFLPKPFRGFAFVTFEDPNVAARLIGQSVEISDDCTVHVRSAVPKPTANSIQSNQKNIIAALKAATSSNFAPWENLMPSINKNLDEDQATSLNFLSSSIFNSNSAEATAAALAAKYTRARYQNKWS